MVESLQLAVGGWRLAVGYRWGAVARSSVGGDEDRTNRTHRTYVMPSIRGDNANR